MSYPIYECSPKARAKIKGYHEHEMLTVDTHHSSKYKFEMLQVGYAFAVPISEDAEGSLRILATRYGKRYNRKFTVIKHADSGVIEVARIG